MFGQTHIWSERKWQLNLISLNDQIVWTSEQTIAFSDMTITPRFWVPKHLLAEIAKLHIEERHALGRVIFATSWFCCWARDATGNQLESVAQQLVCIPVTRKQLVATSMNPMYLEAEMILGQLHHRWVERCWNSKAGFASSKSILTGRPSFLADNLPMYCSLVKVRWSGETLPILAWLYIFSLQLEKNCVCCATGFFFMAPAQTLGFSDFPENGAAQNHGISPSIYDPSPCHKHDELAVSGWKRWWKANWGPSADPIHISIWEWHGMDKKITRNMLNHPKRAGFPGAIKYHQILWINPWNYGSTVDHLQFLQFSTVFYSHQLISTVEKNHGILDPPWSSPSAWRTPKQWPPAKEMGQGEAQALSSWGYPKRWYWYSWFISWKISENPIKVDDLLLNMAI